MSIIGRDAFGNAKKVCDLCGESGNVSLYDGELHACMTCMITCAERVLWIKHVDAQRGKQLELPRGIFAR